MCADLKEPQFRRTVDQAVNENFEKIDVRSLSRRTREGFRGAANDIVAYFVQGSADYSRELHQTPSTMKPEQLRKFG
jgi:hypothetical protein